MKKSVTPVSLSFGQGGPHHLQRLDVVLLIAATVRHIYNILKATRGSNMNKQQPSTRPVTRRPDETPSTWISRMHRVVSSAFVTTGFLNDGLFQHYMSSTRLLFDQWRPRYHCQFTRKSLIRAQPSSRYLGGREKSILHRSRCYHSAPYEQFPTCQEVTVLSPLLTFCRCSRIILRQESVSNRHQLCFFHS